MNENRTPEGGRANEKGAPPHLTIDSHVVVQLGAELITDPEQALLELIKNSYDADADWCNVVIDTTYKEPLSSTGLTSDKVNKDSSFRSPEGPSQQLTGIISVEDNGEGMAPDQIKKGWLSISLSFKREAKQTGRLTNKHLRFPMGDKGLGRISSMRLGDLLRVTTHHSTDLPGSRIWFRWSDCRSGVPLDEVPVGEEIVPATGKTGTKVEIVGLHDLDHWGEEAARKSLQAKMSSMVSPFKQFDGFLLSLQVNEAPTDLVALSSKILNGAVSHFTCTWDETGLAAEAQPKKGILTLSGQVKLELFKGKDAASFERFLATDKGKGLFEFLAQRPFVSKYTRFDCGDGGWFLSFNTVIEDVDIPWKDTARKGKRLQKQSAPQQAELLPLAPKPPISFPGPFNSELYGFSYDDKTFQNLLAGDVLDKEFVQELSGVAVFRDGFRVRTGGGGDWLRFADSFTSGSSFYGLRPKNTLGYVALTSQYNHGLKETSNRENFVDNEEWRTFYTLMTYFRDFANDALEDLRRAYSMFIKPDVPKVPTDSSGEHPLSPHQALERFLVLKRAGDEQLVRAEKSRAATMAALNETTQKLNAVRIRSEDHASKALADELQREVHGLRQQVEKAFLDSTDLYQRLSTVGQAAEVIEERFSQLEGQIEEVYEHVAIGLAAQGVVHDVHGLIDEILARISRIESIASGVALGGQAISKEVLNTKTIVRLIGKQLGTLNPMLRQYREMKESISLLGFLQEFFELRKQRYQDLKICPFLPDAVSDFRVRMNRGRLTQVVDNIVRNSEYWLLDGIGRDFKIAPEIHVELSGVIMKIWDSGRGIRPAMEDTLFDLFVTDKPREHGQGLGLFIVRQILKFENCSISLGPERNTYGRRFKFYIDFSGALDDNK